ncbi:MAG: hypothetical protein U5K79_05860 [Cyclobacteriaceae bacterium]|nr:hypothetical protein [Cyclobacteriaceae bacterium]
MRLDPVYTKYGSLPVNLKTANGQYAALWHFRNELIAVDSKIMKLGDVATVSKQKTGNDIYKKDQQYQLYILYDFYWPW